jgi:hypothetical protein
MEQVLYRVHVRTVTVWCAIASPFTRKFIEKFALISSILSFFFLIYLHSLFVGSNINSTTNCFLNEMKTNAQTIKEFDLISIHISRDWSTYHLHPNNNNLFDSFHSVGPLIYDEFTNMMGLHYDELSSKDNTRGRGRLDTRSILNSILLQLEGSMLSPTTHKKNDEPPDLAALHVSGTSPTPAATAVLEGQQEQQPQNFPLCLVLLV